MNQLPQRLRVEAVAKKSKISLSVGVARRRHRPLPVYQVTIKY